MGTPSEKPSRSLRSAVERTLSVGAGQAEETRRRALELLDEVSRRSDVARARLEEAFADLRSTASAPGTGGEGPAEPAGRQAVALSELSTRLDLIEARLRALESSEEATADSNPQVEGEE